MRTRTGSWTKRGLSWLLAVSMVLTAMAIAVPTAAVIADTPADSALFARQDYDSFTPGTYAAYNSQGIHGNGSGREVSDAHSHAGNGEDGAGRSIRLKMNQAAESNVAQMAVINQAKVTPAITKGAGDYVSLWMYMEGSGTQDIHLHIHSVTNIDSPTAGYYCETKKDVTVQKGGWQRVSLFIKDAGSSAPASADARYFTIGAHFDGATTENVQYLFVDDVEVRLYNATPGGENYELYDAGDTSLDLGASGGTITVSTEQNRTKNGDRSLKVTSRTNAGGPRPQLLLTDGDKNIIRVEQGGDYEVSFWVYFPKNASDLEFRFWLCATDSTEAFTAGADKDACVLYEKNSGTGVTAGMWRQFVVPVSNCNYSGYLRLGVTTNGASSATPSTFYVDDIEVTNSITGRTALVFEDYNSAAVGTNSVNGNGSGREVSDAHSHIGNGEDGAGKSVRLKMNQTLEGKYARTVVRTGSSNILFKTGVAYAVSFWVYWDPAENTDEHTQNEDMLAITFNVGTNNRTNAVYDAYVNGEEGSDGMTLLPNQWQQVTVLTGALEGVKEEDVSPETTYMTVGAYFDGASDSRARYLYVDDVTVTTYDEWEQEYLSDAIQAPNRALLFYANGSAVYWSESRGKTYGAMRLIGEYACLNGDASKVVCGGAVFNIQERGILLGNANATTANLTYNSCMHKTSVSGKDLYNCWGYHPSAGTAEFTLLLNNIPESKKDTYYKYRSYLRLMIAGESVILYSPLRSLSVQHLYDSVRNASGVSPKWYGDVTGPGASSVISFKDGFNSRFAVVYPAGDAAAQAAAETLQTGLAEALGKNVFSVSCYSDATADTGGYEILVGNTNRAGDDGAVSALAAKNAQYDVAFMYRMNGRKLAVEARNTGDATKYAYALDLAVEYFLEQYSQSLSVPATLDFCSSAESENNNGKSLFVGAGGENNLLNNVQIIVEKYPSYMAMSAAKDVQRAVALLSGQYISIVKYQGVEHTNGVSIVIGPKQGAVKAIYDSDGYISGVQDNGLLKFDGESPSGKTGSGSGAGYDDGEFLMEEDYDANTYRISVSGSWPNFVVQVNGGSMYAVNAGAQALVATLRQDRRSGGTRTGCYDSKYSLSDGYGLAYNEEFNYTTEAALLKNWTIDGGNATAGPTKVDPDQVSYEAIEKGTGVYWDRQERPAIWGTDGTFYANGGYLYEYTRKSDTGYWAVRATTQNKMNYRYGFTEVRMIAATDNGACSAIWLVNTGIPHLENDVYENFGHDLLRPNLHYWGANGVHGSLDGVSRPNYTLADGSHFYDTFHYIGYEWDASSISFYVDGEAYFTVDTTQALGTITRDQMDIFRRDAWIKITNGVGTETYSKGYDPADYVYQSLSWWDINVLGKTTQYHAPEGGKYDFRNIEQFKEVQVVDYMYIFQKNDGVSYVRR